MWSCGLVASRSRTDTRQKAGRWPQSYRDAAPGAAKTVTELCAVAHTPNRVPASGARVCTAGRASPIQQSPLIPLRDSPESVPLATGLLRDLLPVREVSRIKTSGIRGRWHLSQAEPVHTCACTHTLRAHAERPIFRQRCCGLGIGGVVAAESSVPSGTLALLSCQGPHPLNHLSHLLGHLLCSSHWFSLSILSPCISSLPTPLSLAGHLSRGVTWTSCLCQAVSPLHLPSSSLGLTLRPPSPQCLADLAHPSSLWTHSSVFPSPTPSAVKPASISVSARHRSLCLPSLSLCVTRPHLCCCSCQPACLPASPAPSPWLPLPTSLRTHLPGVVRAAQEGYFPPVLSTRLICCQHFLN